MARHLHVKNNLGVELMSVPGPSAMSDFADERGYIKDYMQVLACRYIGDESSYNKFIVKQASVNNDDATHKQMSVAYMQSLKDRIASCIDYFSNSGHSRIADFCLSVMNLEQPVFPKIERWSICSLTGVNSNQSLQLGAAGDLGNVDIRHEPFVRGLWICSHVNDIEHMRISNFMSTQDSLKSITLNISEYLDSSHFPSETHMQIYFDAFSMVLGVLEGTEQYIINGYRDM